MGDTTPLPMGTFSKLDEVEFEFASSEAESLHVSCSPDDSRTTLTPEEQDVAVKKARRRISMVWPGLDSPDLSELHHEGGNLGTVFRRLMPWLYLGALFSYLDRGNLSYAALQLNSDLGFTPATYGMGSGIFFLAYTIFEVPSNLMLARVGGPKWLSRILISWGLIAACGAGIYNAAGFFALRLALGVAEAGYYPGSSMFLSKWITGAEFGQAYAIITLGSCTSGILGGPLAMIFLSMDNVLGLRGWQWLFLVEGIPTVVLGLAFPLVVPRSPSHAKWLTPAEARWLESRAQQSAREKPGHSTKAPTWESSLAAVKAAATYWRVWYLGIVHMCGLCSYYGILFWGPLIVRDIVHGRKPSRNVDLRVIGLSMVPYAFASVALTVNAWHSRKTREVRWHAVVPLTIAACALAALGPLAAAGQKGWAITALIVATVGAWADHGPRATMWEGLMAGESQAAAFAIINSLGNCGGFIGPYLMGALHRAGGDSSLGTLVLACFLGFAGWLMALYPFPSTQAGAQGVAREELRWQAENSPYSFGKASSREDLLDHRGSSPGLKRVTEEAEEEGLMGGNGRSSAPVRSSAR